jgi:uncharacterized protein
MYPTLKEIETLHKKYAPNDRLFDLVFTHCKIVRDIAVQIAIDKKLSVNEELLITGALLHDIGTYAFIEQFEKTGESKYYQHAVAGYQIVKNEGVPEDVCKIVQHHMRLGLTKEQIKYESLDIPLEDYSPVTTEEEVVMYADKFHSKKPQFNSYESYLSFIQQFGKEQVVKFESLSKKLGIPELESLAEKYNHPIV